MCVNIHTCRVDITSSPTMNRHKKYPQQTKHRTINVWRTFNVGDVYFFYIRMIEGPGERAQIIAWSQNLSHVDLVLQFYLIHALMQGHK